MSKVILHIGTHKAASTTIQDTFYWNSDRLAQHGLIYPRLSDRFSGHHGLVYEWVRLPKLYQLEASCEDVLGLLAEDYAKSDKTVFLSSEEFSRCQEGNRVDLAQIRRWLSPFDEIEVICFVRPQWQFLQSIYVEQSRHRMPKRPSALVEEVCSTGNMDGIWLEYNGLLDQLEEVFAPEEITFFDFATACAAPGGVLGTLLRHLGVDMAVDKLELLNDGMSNVSTSHLAVWVAHMLTDKIRPPAHLVDVAREALEIHFETFANSTLFTTSEFERLTNRFEAPNAAFEARRAAVQPGFKLTDPKRDTLQLYRNQIGERFWFRMARRTVFAYAYEGNRP